MTKIHVDSSISDFIIVWHIKFIELSLKEITISDISERFSPLLVAYNIPRMFFIEL